MFLRKLLPLLLLLSACASKSVTNREQVKSTVKSILPEVKQCYETGLKQNTDLHGKILTSFEVNDHGKVGRCEVKTSELQSSNVESCVCQKISNATFPPAPRGKMAVVDYPFVFSRQ